MPWRRRTGPDPLDEARRKARATEKVVKEAQRETERTREFTDANHLVALAAALLGAKPRT
jgi:hypothetical protein